MTEYHARYGGNGVMICWHVERKNVCIYSQLKSCSSPEVAAMLAVRDAATVTGRSTNGFDDHP
jgi:TnpA family transposase